MLYVYPCPNANDRTEKDTLLLREQSRYCMQKESSAEFKQKKGRYDMSSEEEVGEDGALNAVEAEAATPEDTGLTPEVTEEGRAETEREDSRVTSRKPPSPPLLMDAVLQTRLARVRNLSHRQHDNQNDSKDHPHTSSRNPLNDQ
ncbi:hypothetical protein AAG570_009198 [Ranatra chinensis]|uniref:Uncharacterized protein n=1 Tax=Ranatra chinensis TaxID=642074 RepID=A0ABD0ZA44_9HEMI